MDEYRSDIEEEITIQDYAWMAEESILCRKEPKGAR